MVKFIRDKLGINKDNNQGQQGNSGDQGQQNSGPVIPKDASTEVVTASPSNILVADKSRGFNQANVTATGYIRPLQDGGAVKKSVAAEEYTKQVKNVVASTSNTVDASGLSAAKDTIATEVTSKAKDAIESQGMRADGIEISEITDRKRYCR